MFRSRRGSLNLSINAIVVLILAITMLGLGLGFMRTMFGGVTDSFGDVTQEMNKEMIERLAEGAKKATLSVYELEMKQSSEEKIYLAIKDELAQSGSPETYTITGFTGVGINGALCPTLEGPSSITISVGEAKVIPLRVKTTSTHIGTCYFEVKVISSEGEYASEDLYINIK